MKQSKLLRLTLALVLTSSMVFAQERGTWSAASSNARSITGDVALANEKISINFATFPISRIRDLKPAELKAAFDLDGDPSGAAGLYKVNIPAAKKFLRKNSLCGGEDTQWMVAYGVGHNLQLAFFSGATVPVFTPEAIATTTTLCGIYAYVK